MTRPGGKWENWARTVRTRPLRIERPASVDAVQRAVLSAARSNLRVKAVGAGHSFSGIAVAPEVLLDLSDLQGVIEVDRERMRVRMLSGTRLHQIPRLLRAHGLAMQNLGDIDRQSISGAISTGTHGTGAAFGGISTQIVGATFVDADGALRTVSDVSRGAAQRATGDDGADGAAGPGSIPLQALALGLGALGIIVDVTLQCVPAFVLHSVERPEPLDALLGELPERVAAADHFEFYWFPHTDVALTKTHTRLPGDAPRTPLPWFGRWRDGTLLANGVYRVACALGVVIPAIIPRFARLAVRLTGDREYTDVSNQIFTQSRTVRFREMEYAFPAEQVVPAFNQLRALIAERGWRISFPVEVRFAASDDLWLSTAHGRNTGYIAVHRYHRENPTEYFEAVERIMMAHDGRPHWGKMHTMDASQLAERYPRFADFVALRDRTDPDRRFTNTYLDRVLGA